MAIEYPLAELELTRSGKRKATYAVRGIIVGLAWFLVAFIWLTWTMSMSAGESEMAAFLGEAIGRTASAFQFFAVFVVAPLFTAGLVAQEKRDRTLGLLLIADIGGTDIFLSKFLSAFLYVEFLSLSALPIQAIAATLGGIPVPAMALQTMLLAVAAAATCAIGLLASTIASRPIEGLFYAVILEALWLGSTLSYDMVGFTSAPILNIAVAAWLVSDPFQGMFFWIPSLILTVCVAIPPIALTIRLIPRQVHARPAKGRKRRLRVGRFHRELVPLNATARLASAGTPGLPVFNWSRPMQYLVAIALIPVSALPCFGQIFILALIVYDITSSVTAARQDGSMDSLFVSPVEDKALARSMATVFARRALLFLPALIAPGLIWLAISGGIKAGFVYVMPSGGVPGALHILMVIFTHFLSPTALFALYVALGCWASTLRYKPMGQAVAAIAVLFGIQITVGIASGILFIGSSIATSAVTAGGMSIVELVTSILGAVLGITVNTILSVAFYSLFATYLRQKWRTGIAQLAPSSAS